MAQAMGREEQKSGRKQGLLLVGAQDSRFGFQAGWFGFKASRLVAKALGSIVDLFFLGWERFKPPRLPLFLHLPYPLNSLQKKRTLLV